MLRILVADDHPVFRRGLKQIIGDASDLVVAAEAANGAEALRKARTGDFDVVLLDITMPVKNGVDVLSQLKRDRPGLPVLVVSMHPEEQYAVRALRAGASGYLTKERRARRAGSGYSEGVCGREVRERFPGRALGLHRAKAGGGIAAPRDPLPA